MKHFFLITLAILCSFTVLLSSNRTPVDCAAGRGNAAPPNIWSYTYGGISNEHIRTLKIANNGDYIVLGITNSFGATSPNWWILRLDPFGKVIWEKYFDWTRFDRAWSMTETSDDGFVVTGSSRTPNSEDAIIVKFNGDGDLVWQTSFLSASGEYRLFSSIDETQDGGFILTGQINPVREETWIVKLNADGGIIWEKLLGGSGIYRVIELSGGNLLFAGRSSAGAGGYDLWVEKLTSDGTSIWQKTYGGVYAEYLGDVLETSDNQYVLTGYAQLTADGPFTGLVIKLDADGNIVWQNAYGGNDIDYIFSIDETTSGDLLVAGYSQSFGDGDKDYWLMKLDASGEIIWQKNYGGTNNNDIARTIQETSDGGIIVGGDTISVGEGGYDIWVMKLDSDGNLGECSLEFDGLAELQNPSATISDTAFTSEDITSATILREYITQETAAVSDWICPFYFRYLPYLAKQ